MDYSQSAVELRQPSALPFTRLSGRKRSILYTQFGRMLDVGLSPVRCLQTLGGQRMSRRLSRACYDMAAHVQGGGILASAFARHPNLFPANEVRMMEASERAGKISETMLRLSGSLDSMTRFWRKFVTGLLYPAILLLGVHVFVPVLLAALFDLGGGPARMLMRKMAEVGLLWVACLGVMTIWRSFAALSAMRSVLHAVLLWVPVFGKLSRRLATARFADTLECLYAAGVPTPEALSRSAAACGNAAIGRRILDSVWLVREGGTITSALQASRALPSLLLNMVATGEEAGKLEESLHKVAEYEREDAGVVIERLAKVLPTIIVLAVIGLLAYMVLSAWGVVLRIPFAVN